MDLPSRDTLISIIHVCVKVYIDLKVSICRCIYADTTLYTYMYVYVCVCERSQVLITGSVPDAGNY